MSPSRKFAIGLALFVGWSATAQPSPYGVRPSSIAPSGSGETRRIAQSFGDWTLVCDEFLTRRQRVCNVSQEIIDNAGHPVFSWSLAGTSDGAPVLIVRAPPGPFGSRSVHLAFEHGFMASVRLDRCASSTCLGFLPVTREIVAGLHVGKQAEATLLIEGRFETIALPLRGLGSAVAALKPERSR